MTFVDKAVNKCKCGHMSLSHSSRHGHCVIDECFCPSFSEETPLEREVSPGGFRLFDAPKSEKETVNHPDHYGGDTPYEVIKVLEAWGLDQDFCLGNTVKYIARAGKKDTEAFIKDLKKAQWYLERRIKRLEEKANSGTLSQAGDTYTTTITMS